MKKILLLLILLSSVLFAQTNMVVFYGQGCPHCAALESWLQTYQPQHPELNVTYYEVYYNQQNRKLMQKFASAYNTKIEGVPTVFINNKVIVGYSDETRQEIINQVNYCQTHSCINPFEKAKAGANAISALTIPLVLSAAAVDAINPCAFAVLILLLGTICMNANRKKALYSGLAFATAVYISYFLMGLGLFKAIQAASFSHLLYKIIGGLAIILGLVNLKDYFSYGAGGFVMEVPRSWRPLMKKFIKGVVSVKGSFLIGFLISLFLLPCTSGPYIVILGMLANQATMAKAIPLLLLYNLIFILPMIAISLFVYFGLSTAEQAEKIRKTKIKVLHLIAGVILILMGIIVLISA